MKKISILGSTGSIGIQTLDVIRKNKSEYEVVALSCHSSIDQILDQIKEFKPKHVAIWREDMYKELKEKLNGIDIEIHCGMEGLIAISTLDEVDVLVTSVVGNIGLQPTVEAIKKGKTIALANKETLVTSGQIIMPLLKQYGATIIPVDSEHSAIFQCLQGNTFKTLKKVILTASGGPFRGMNKEMLHMKKASDALKHPKWNMGKKISIDSATLMNKGLEVIEAKWLFGVEADQIDVVVHPQSIIHSMVEYNDTSIIAQMGLPDMRLPIHYALNYPDRTPLDIPKMSFAEITQLTFEQPDKATFPCLELAYEALRIGGTMPCVLNAANEELVYLYLQDKIGFYDIPKTIEALMQKHELIKEPTIDDILGIDQLIRKAVIERRG